MNRPLMCKKLSRLFFTAALFLNLIGLVYAYVTNNSELGFAFLMCISPMIAVLIFDKVLNVKLQRRHRELNQFVAHWRVKNLENPEVYPKEMTVTDWQQRFYDYRDKNEKIY